jgi:hypothetical protein
MTEETPKKVIEFPKHKVVREVPEQIQERDRRANQKYADTITDDLTSMLITELDNYMIDVQEKKFTRDLVLVVDALKASIYRSFGLEHHLHDFIDKNVKLIDGASIMTKEELAAKIEEIISEIDSEEEE